MQMKGKLLLTRSGGGNKVEIRPGRNGGWLVLDFAYNTDGSREKTNEQRVNDDDYVIELMKQDPEFYDRFVRLSGRVYMLELSDQAMAPIPGQMELPGT
jgi:hypothetical protein